MCGIAGLTGRRDPARLQAMLDAIAHRGPDDEGQRWIDTDSEWVGLGNRRLAILDLTAAGHQPMGAGDDVLTYNGEVYNFRALRRELEGTGAAFGSGADTEVVLQVLRRYGAAGLERFNGMFALAYWDADRHELLLARDRFGMKPLYYRVVGGELMFASEAKCLVAAGAPAELALSALGSYLSFGWVPGARTLYRDVVELPPGHVLRWKAGRATVECFRDTVPAPEPDMSAHTAAQTLQHNLRDAVRRQMVADVPVGVLLSGGLDSSAIAAFAAEESQAPVVRAYTIAFRPEDARLEQSSDDARCARLVADRFGLELEEFVVTPNVADLLTDVAWHLDDPVADPAAILTLIISRAAASQVKVLLSGQGSDELFGGYRVHMYDRVAAMVARQPGWMRGATTRAVDALPGIASRSPTSPGLLLAAHRASRNILDHIDAPPEERYVGYRSAYYFSPEGLTDLLTADARAEALADSPWALHLDVFDQVRDLPFFDRMLYVDLKTFLANQNLAYSDRLSMAASIEMRVPFLDDEVADLAGRIPESLKMRRLKGKDVLRRSMEGILPREIIWRRKAAFAAPIRSWLQSELAPLVGDVLSDRWLTDTGLFEPVAVRRLIDDHQSGRVDHTYRIWTLLTFALWHTAHLALR